MMNPRRRRPGDNESGRSGRTPTAPARTDDIAFGQIVIVTARWILVAAGLLLSLILPGPIEQLRVQVVVLLLLAVGNFFLHAQLLMKRPSLDLVAYGASAADLTVITLLVATQGGFTSGVYVFYFPALLAIAVTFPMGATAIYTAGVVIVYGLIAIGETRATLESLTQFGQVTQTRLVMLVAVAVLGTIYRNIERDRRAASSEAQTALAAEVQAR